MRTIETEIAVVGAGPGGYAAAFYAADKGKKVILIERDQNLGGVCLNRGCIPSKALLHATKLIEESRESAKRGITFTEPQVNLDQLRSWKDAILTKLAQSVAFLAQKRGVQVLAGRAYFEDSKTLRVETPQGQTFVHYEQAIIAVGSKSSMPKAFDLGNPRIMTSREALEIEDIPKTMLIVGGGYIGMEMGTVYARLGTAITVVEAMDKILATADPDLVRPIVQRATKEFKEIRLRTKVAKMATSGKQIKVTFETDGQQTQELFDRVLVAVGRSPHCEDLGLENTKVQRDEKGFIVVNERQQTDDPLIYAIGDAVGGAMLAHKAHKEARVAVEVLCGENSEFKDIIIPAVVFTEPELAWCGLTEGEAREKGIAIETAKFPWTASGRALTFDRPDGVTKLIIEPETDRLLGIGIVGHGAGELISEGVLALEMGATVHDLAESVHPHPTMSETIMECAESYRGHATHLLARRKTPPPSA